MVGVFARLKLRTLVNIAASSAHPSLAVLAVLVILAGGLSTAWLARFLVIRVGADGLLVGGIYSIVAVVWLMGPVVMASIDETLEPRLFEGFALTRVELASGLTVAGMISPGSAYTLLLVLGVASGQVSVVGAGSAAIGAVVAAIIVWLLCLLEARFLTTLVSDLLRWRRGREVVSLAAVILLMVPSLLPVALIGGSVRDLSRVADVVRWNPFGALGLVSERLSDGDWPLAGGVVIAGVGLAGLLIGGFGWALGRLAVRTGDAAPVRRAHSGRAGPGWAGFLSGPSGAVAFKELKYLRRDVRVKAQLLASVVIAGALVFRAITGGLGPWAPLTVSLVSFALVAPLMFNTFGLDGGSFWVYVASGVSGRKVLLGKVVAYLLGLTPLVLVVLAVLAWASQSASYIIAGLFGALGTMALFVGVGAVIAVYAAYQLPEQNLFATRSAGQFRVMLFGLGGFVVAGLAMVPMVLLLGVGYARAGAVGVTMASVVAAIYGGLMLLMGVWVGGMLYDERAVRLIDVLDGE